jgi:hypothetical protein
MYTLLDGNPDLGKSTIVADLAARVTTGGPMPLETVGGSPADVILFAPEDVVGVTIRPRLRVAGADLKRVHVVQAMPEPGDEDALPTLSRRNIERIEEDIVERHARLVVVDPLMANLPDGVNPNHDAEVRRVLTPLSKLAERTGAAIMIVRHLNKDEDRPALYRGGGSIGIIGAGRSALLVAPDRTSPDVRILGHLKCNVARKASSLRYRIVEAEGAGRVEWLGTVDIPADELLRVPDRGDSADSGVLGAVANAFQTVLHDGPMLSKEAEEAVLAMTGASPKTIERGRARLALKATKTADGWMLSLRDKAAIVPPEGVADGLGGTEQPTPE